MKAESRHKELRQAYPIQPKKARPKLSFVDNRLQAAGQTKLVQAIQKRESNTDIIQRDPMLVTVRGTTHLVTPRGNSIFRGDVIKTLTHGMRVEIDTENVILSRRGPNQRFYRAKDLVGPRIYKWFKVNTIDKVLVDGYIRIGTFDGECLPDFMQEQLPNERSRLNGDLPRQNITLLGTIHSPENKSKDAHYDPSKDLIVEYPTPYRKEPTDTKSSVGDPTQNDLVRMADGKGRIIGADGRKVFKSGKTHRLTLRHQSDFKVSEKYGNIPNLKQLASDFIDSCLGLGDVDFSRLKERICQLVDYKDKKEGPDVPLILNNDFYRVSTITRYFTWEVKDKMKKRLMDDLGKELELSKKETDDGIDEYRKQAEDKMALLRDEAGFTEYVVRKIRYDYGLDDSIDIDDNQIECVKKDERSFIKSLLSNVDKNIKDLRDQYFVDLVSIFYDTICNLTLYSEVLANDNEDLVVAFGNAHITTLRVLLEDLKGIHKDLTF